VAYLHLKTAADIQQLLAKVKAGEAKARSEQLLVSALAQVRLASGFDYIGDESII